MAHIDLAQGTGGLRPPLRDGQGSLDIQQLPWTVDRGSRQVGTSLRSAVDRTHSRQCLASSTPTKDEGGRLTTDNVSRAPLQESSVDRGSQWIGTSLRSAVDRAHNGQC